MKILKAGSLTTSAPWWVGKTAQCGACGCQVELDEGDDAAGPLNLATPRPELPFRISAYAERHPGGKQWVEGPCPTKGCTGKITTTNVAGPLVPSGDYNPPLAKP